MWVGRGLVGGGQGIQPERGRVPNLGAAAEERETPSRSWEQGRVTGESAEKRPQWGPESSSGQRIIIVLMDTAAPWL